MSAIFFIIALVLMAPGVLLPLIPLVPALLYLFLIALTFGFIDGFSALAVGELLTLLVFVGLSLVVDQSAGIIGAKYGGAHTKSIFWGIGGGILGLFALPPFGAPIGLFIAVFAAEVYYHKTHKQALRAAGGAVAGALTGMVINMALAVAFIGTFAFFVLR
jgi:uncharacterized protein YqgC (DUF456 family)